MNPFSPNWSKGNNNCLKQGQAPGFEAAPAPLEGSVGLALSWVRKKGTVSKEEER